MTHQHLVQLTSQHLPRPQDLETHVPKGHQVQPGPFNNDWDDNFKKMEEKIEAKMHNQLKNKGKLLPLNDIDTMCDQLSMSSFSNDIKLVVPPLKFFALKCPFYKKTKDLVAYVIHFKMIMAVICMLVNKRDVMFCNLFATISKKWLLNYILIA